MEIASKIFFGFLLLVVFSFGAGFIDVWWEQRKRAKEQEERERLQRKGGEDGKRARGKNNLLEG